VGIVAIPDPSLVVLIGAAGAGKTTFAARHFDRSEVLSSDRYRALIAGDEADQGVTNAAFGRLHRDLTRRLAEGRLTVVDATNVERASRRTLLARARAAGVAAVAIVLDLPAAVVLARNAARHERVVDELAVRHHLARMRSTLDGPGAGLRAEGFAQVVVVRDQLELDSVTVVRLRDERRVETLGRPRGDAGDRGGGQGDPNGV
jgi:protein phosphatase